MIAGYRVFAVLAILIFKVLPQFATNDNNFQSNSNLNFAAANDKIEDDDIEGQMKLRSSRFWGRLYINGWPQTIQYFVAHFGISPPYGLKKFIFADPKYGCTPLKELSNDYVVLVHRGTCTFAEKAQIVYNSKASGIIIINNAPGIEHLHGTAEVQNIQLSVSSISQLEGTLLETAYQHLDPNESLEGFMVPMNCINSQCKSATVEEAKLGMNVNEGGLILSQHKNAQIEYLIAYFGTSVPPEKKALDLVASEPEDACDTITNNVKGKVVLVKRGNCEFYKKAEVVQNAGGHVAVIGTVYPYIVRMSVEPRYKGLNITIPVVMVSNRAYDLLADKKVTQTIRFQKNNDVNYTVWEHLEKVSTGHIKKLNEVSEYVNHYKNWPDRKATLDALKSKFPALLDLESLSKRVKSEL